MTVAIERVSLMTDNFTRPLGWDNVIGMDAASGVSLINIEIEASGVNTSFPIPVDVTSRLPNRSAGPGTLATAVRWNVLPSAAAASRPDRSLFRLSRPVADAGPFTGQSGLNDVATIVRSGGTSDSRFRTALGWPVRGVGTQPTAVGASTGNESGEVPDALTLLKAAGVEVLDVAVVPNTAWQSNATRGSRLVRKPAKVVYYSGHGLSHGANCLGIETGSHSYACWASPADLLAAWTLPACSNLDLFVIAGCSVLRYIPAAGAPPRDTIGQEWAQLLTNKRGPLTTLLGYAESAPLDSTAGDAVANEFATRLAHGSRSYVIDWLEINGNRRAWNAVAIDRSGYWWVEPRRNWIGQSEPFARGDIRGPRPIP